MRVPAPKTLILFACTLGSGMAAENVMIADVPDYGWHAGCFGTATANIIGFWDRSGLPNMYTGPTGNGLAPLNSRGVNASIRGLWASQAGVDGRPLDQPGHIEDYWESFDGITSFESTAPDPYDVAGRAEHAPDCIGDFIGLSQNKWSDLNGECSGNIDGFAFTYFATNGEALTNFVPPAVDALEGNPVRDIPSGLREWSRYRGYDAQVTSQLADFNPSVPDGKGFSFEDLKAEINAGYPVLLLLQHHDDLSRALPGNMRANPLVHAMVAYGYVVTDGGEQGVRYRTSWASGDNSFSLWTYDIWESALPLRGVVTYRPAPRITGIDTSSGIPELTWDGPSALLVDNLSESSVPAHWYVVEAASSLEPGAEFSAISDPTPHRRAPLPQPTTDDVFYRVRLLSPEEAGQARR